MKYIKTYERIEEFDYGPQPGDYVICKDKWITVDITTSVQDYHYINFLMNNVGKLEKINMGANKLFYFVSFESIPINLAKDFFLTDGYTISINREEIIFYSRKDREDCEAFIAANKYNL